MHTNYSRRAKDGRQEVGRKEGPPSLLPCCPPSSFSSCQRREEVEENYSLASLPFPQVVSDDRFVEAFAFVEELSDVLGGVLE